MDHVCGEERTQRTEKANELLRGRRRTASAERVINQKEYIVTQRFASPPLGSNLTECAAAGQVSYLRFLLAFEIFGHFSALSRYRSHAYGADHLPAQRSSSSGLWAIPHYDTSAISSRTRRLKGDQGRLCGGGLWRLLRRRPRPGSKQLPRGQQLYSPPPEPPRSNTLLRRGDRERC